MADHLAGFSNYINIWRGYGHNHEKIAYIKWIRNISDNMLYIIAMFDGNNIKKLSETISNEAKKEIYDRLIDSWDIYFNFLFEIDSKDKIW